MTIEQMKQAPFLLDERGIQWVTDTLSHMTDEEKIGQLFFPIAYAPFPGYLDTLLEEHIGGVLFRAGATSEIRMAHGYLQEHSKIPLLLAANLESGGNGLMAEGTPYGCNMQVAASQHPVENAERLGEIACSEAAATGCNYAFAPVVDVDWNGYNPITNVRTFGSDPERVLACGRGYIRGARRAGCATSPKHFPGDGVDGRDQHLLTSVNSLSPEAWEESYGRIYRGMIEEGALSVMVGHIALPRYARALGADERQAMLPATLSPMLIQELLRKRLGFNGMVISDATPMVGFCSAMKREDAVPACIMAGCDMFLFNKDLREDVAYMRRAYERGVLTKERLNDAVTRILCMKAALGLHEKELLPPEEATAIIGCEAHMACARACADESVTLVKDEQGILPLTPRKHRRVLLQVLGDFPSNERVTRAVTEQLAKRGFEVIPYVREGFAADGSMRLDTVEQFKEKYDAVLYIGNIENASNRTTARIGWFTFFGLGNNLPWFVHEVPTVFVSVGNPYHLVDVPMIGTYVNAYANSDLVIEAVAAKLCGESAFKGVNPIDPELGMFHFD